MTDEVRRDVVKLGLDFRAIPVDLGDGIEWEFHPDPSPHQWSTLVGALKEFTKFGEADFGGEMFETALAGFTKAMADMLVRAEQQQEWIEKGYGLGPQQAISEALMGIWTGFPTKQRSRSGKASKKTGSRSSPRGTSKASAGANSRSQKSSGSPTSVQLID
jgi:hypothetical protein